LLKIPWFFFDFFFQLFLTIFCFVLGTIFCNFVRYYYYWNSWFFTYNALSELIPKQDTQGMELGRRAILGFCASAVSDTCSNGIRVCKVYKQSHPEQISYPQVVRNVIKEDGIRGLLFRGLETKILANGLQGILFSILWKQFEEAFFGKQGSRR
jgi:Mitochondrial carrier protein